MPFIHVKSLPFRKPLDISSVVESVSIDFSNECGIGIENVTVSWEFFKPGHCAVGGKTAEYQPGDSHPVIVDLLVPDFNSPDFIGKMMTAAAASISKHAGVPFNNIFVNCRQARSGMVFDDGEIVSW